MITILYALNHMNLVAKLKNISHLKENMENRKRSSSPNLLSCLLIFIKCWHL